MCQVLWALQLKAAGSPPSSLVCPLSFLICLPPRCPAHTFLCCAFPTGVLGTLRLLWVDCGGGRPFPKQVLGLGGGVGCFSCAEICFTLSRARLCQAAQVLHRAVVHGHQSHMGDTVIAVHQCPDWPCLDCSAFISHATIPSSIRLDQQPNTRPTL